jgi:nucleotide-binding universal stress UspA family protein
VYEKILVAVDMSEPSDRAVVAARDLAALSGGKVVLLHVREQQMIVGKGGGVVNLEEPDEANQLVAKDSAVLDSAGIAHETDVRRALTGHASELIVEAAKEHGADVIVIGSHGRGTLRHLLLGSVAYKVLHLTDRPVLVIR